MRATNRQVADASVAVIGSILLEPDLAGEILRRVRAEDISPDCRAIFEGVQRLFAQCRPIDPVTLASAVGKAYEGKILQIMELTPTAANWQEYCKILRESAMLTQLRQAAADITAAPTLEDAVAATERISYLLADRPSVRIISWLQGLADFATRQNSREAPKYIKWGMEPLDKRTYCTQGDLVILAGRPSSGKTMLAAQFAYYMANSLGKYVGIFSLETGDRKIYDRLVAHAAKADFGHIKQHRMTQEELLAVNELGKHAETVHLDVIPGSAMTVQEIQAISLSRHYDVIFVDYLQLISAPGRDRYAQVTNISLALKRMATATGITVVALSQLSRADKGQKNKRPTMSDLRESGQVEQDADLIFILHPNDAENNNSPRTLYIEKQKEGELGYINLDFKPTVMTFTPIKTSGAAAAMKAANEIAREKEQKAQVTFRELEGTEAQEELPF